MVSPPTVTDPSVVESGVTDPSAAATFSVLLAPAAGLFSCANPVPLPVHVAAARHTKVPAIRPAETRCFLSFFSFFIRLYLPSQTGNHRFSLPHAVWYPTCTMLSTNQSQSEHEAENRPRSPVIPSSRR